MYLLSKEVLHMGLPACKNMRREVEEGAGAERVELVYPRTDKYIYLLSR